MTVERKSGEYRQHGKVVEVVDLPGTYSLDVVDREISLDERVARDYVHADEADLIVNIVDAANLERNLYLTTQLIELGAPLVLALNMVDVAESKGIAVDADKLASQLGCPVVPIIVASGKGVAELKAVIAEAALRKPRATARVDYTEALEASIKKLVAELESAMLGGSVPSRWLAVRLLEGDDLVRAEVGEAMVALAREEVAKLGDEIDLLVADARYGLANRLAQAVVRKVGEVNRDLTDRIDSVVLNRVLGIPIFVLMMYLMFMFTINIGGAFIDFFDQFTGALLVDGLGHWMSTLGAPAWLTVLLAKGIGGGIQTVATFIPIIGFLYLFLSVLEGSGYMARAAFVMDRFMRLIGLPGKSFVPLIVGFGCNVPAIMATRTLEHRRDRLMTIAMAPFMSCGARLPVYVLFGTAFFPDSAQNVVFALYLIGIAAAVLTGLMLKKTLFGGEATPFIMELPPYHLPTFKGVALQTWDRLKSFVVRAGRVIVPMVLVLNVLNAVGTDGSFGNENSDKSVLAAVGRTISPLFSPFGLNAENWPATVGIFTGVLAKEAVVGTLDATYQSLAKQDALAAGEAVAAEAPFELKASIEGALATIPANLADAVGKWSDPLGLKLGDLEDQGAAAEQQKVSSDTYQAMAARFDGAAGAFAYLLFILLYFPCTAATAAVFQESGRRWAVFVVGWTTGLAYAAATIAYQIGRYAEHPLTSIGWITAMLILLAGFITAMRLGGLGRKRTVIPIVPVTQNEGVSG